MACDNFCDFVNAVCYFIGFSMNSKFFLVSWFVRSGYALVIQDPTCYYCCCLIGYFWLGKFASTWELRFKDLCVFFLPQFRLILMTPSVAKGGGVVMEYVCNCTNT